jgi:hypothetical protein
MAYTVTTPWEWQTWGANKPWPDKYSRLAGQAITGGSYTGSINPWLTDIARGVTFIVNGSEVTTTMYPYQNDLSSADWYVLGGDVTVITDEQAAVLTAAGYGDYLSPAVPNLIGLSQAAALSAITTNGFVAGPVTTSTEGATPANTGTVKAQQPFAGSAQVQDGVVNIVLYLYQ